MGTLSVNTNDTYVGAVGTESTSQLPGSFYELFPGYAGMHRGQADAATAMFGRRWGAANNGIRQAFVDLWDSVFNQIQTKKVLREVIMENTWRKFPVRTGHLFDYIFRCMYFDSEHWYNTHHVFTMHYRWPSDRPYPITGNVSHTMSTGYSKLPIPPPLYAPPNANFLNFTANTARRMADPQTFALLFGKRKEGDTALWALNDPQAVNNPGPAVDHAGISEIRNMVRSVFQGLRVVLRMQTTGIQGSVNVSQGGQQININQNVGNVMLG